jgi:periplasmic protein TonB
MLAPASVPLSDFYTWGFSGAPIQIHLSLDVVSRIRKQIQDSGKAPGVLSGCGLLIGDTPKPGITGILDFEPLQTLNAASVELAAARASGEVVGFYSTTPTRSISMPDEDKALAASFFRRPSSVFLLIETEKTSIGEARFCFWGEGEELFDWPMMLFPFDAKELAIQESRRRSSVVRDPSQKSHASKTAGVTEETLPADERLAAAEAGHGIVPAGPETYPAARSAPPPESPAGRGRERTAPEPAAKRPGRRRLAQGLAMVVAAILSMGAWMSLRRGANPPVAAQAVADRALVKTPLGLVVEMRGSGLQVSWNGNAAVISKANFGMLLIRGKDVNRDVPLTAEELRAGSVVYAALVDQVRFQLNVVAGEEVARESLTVVLPRAPEAPAIPARVTSSKSGNSFAKEASAAPRPAAPSRVLAPLREFKPAASRAPAPATPLRLNEPPPVIGAIPVNSGTPFLPTHPPVSLAAPIASTAKGSPTAEPTTEPIADAKREPSLLAAEAHPPVATHQVIPSIPAGLKAVIWAATAVDVTVSVDASGSVVKAEAVAKPGLNPLLRDAAVQAALRWRFQPAQFNGHPVPANVVLQFNFAGSR